MSRTGVEAKPPWEKVPRAVRAEAERILEARIDRANRVYGGYAPSATYRLALADGRRAFFKGIWRESNDYMHSALATEERVYRELGPRLAPWAPAFLGSLRVDDWHALLLEDLGPADVPPWTGGQVRAAAREMAAFHDANAGWRAPEWVSRDDWTMFADRWSRFAAEEGAIAGAAGLAGARALEAEAWIREHLHLLEAAALKVKDIGAPFTLLHEDTRSDNVRLTRGRLRLFDWNFISVGPAEFDVIAFGESIASESGRPPNAFVDEYERSRPVRRELLGDVVSGFAAYFTDVAWRPPRPELPRIREVQRRQMKACVPWAALLLDLPRPDWIDAVPD